MTKLAIKDITHKMRRQYRAYLNDLHGVPTKDNNYHCKGNKNQFGPKRRPYGDYLYYQDREMFDWELLEWELENRLRTFNAYLFSQNKADVI